MEKNNIEKRSLKVTHLRMADSSDTEKRNRTVEGYAAVFKTWAEFTWMREMIMPGAFAEALKNSDCRALLNHDSNQLLAREKSNTLELKEDEKGLWFRFDIPESRDDILEMIERGDIDECSFAFTIKEQRWVWDDTGTGKDERYIERISELYDIALVTYPAYPNTSVALRYKNENNQQVENDKKDSIQRDADARDRHLSLRGRAL